jgi:hypothetical protein
MQKEVRQRRVRVRALKDPQDASWAVVSDIDGIALVPVEPWTEVEEAEESGNPDNAD